MEYNFKNLTFRGGGVLGVAYAGVIQALDEKGIYEGVERVSGASAGAITSMLVGLRYSMPEILKILKETSFKDFMDRPNPARILTKYGYYEGDWALDWLKKLVKESSLGLKEDATFADLEKAGGREIYMYATDVNTHTAVELSGRNTPDVILAEAARASMSIPLFFEAFQFSQGLNDHIYVDGGMVFNFPMSVFDEPHFLELDEEVNAGTLGFYFVPPPNQKQVVYEFGYKQFLKFFTNTFETILASQNINFQNDPQDVARTVQVSNCGISATDFDLSAADQQQLIQSGYNSTMQYLNNYGTLS